MLFKMIYRIAKHILLLYFYCFRNSLINQLTNSCLLMYSILVRINTLKYNFGKQKSVQIIGLFFIKRKMWIAQGKKNLSKLTEV